MQNVINKSYNSFKKYKALWNKIKMNFFSQLQLNFIQKYVHLSNVILEELNY